MIQGNLIGTDATGTVGLGNGLAAPSGYGVGQGIWITEGGSAKITGNVISANPYGIVLTFSGPTTEIQDNRIGTDITGTKALGNTQEGILAYGPATIGGTSAADRNIISGNGTGIDVRGDNDVIQGNYIGTDITGTHELGNDGGSSNSQGEDGGGILLWRYRGDGFSNAKVVGNLISGNGIGMDLMGDDGSGSVFQGNLIGTDYTGTQPLGNWFGILFQDGGSNYTIGGTTPGAGNIISGNRTGISMVNYGTPAATGDAIEGNFIGTNAAGATNLGNGGDGVRSEGYFSGTQIGGTIAAAANVIADNGGEGIDLRGGNGNVVQGNSIIGNGDNGVYLESALNTMVGGTTEGAGNIISSNSGGVVMYSGTGNSILGNSIHDNPGVGIFLTGGANNNQKAAVLTTATSSATGTSISGTLASVANTTFRIELFANPSSGSIQGQTYLGFTTVTTDSNGNGNFTVALPTGIPAGQGYLTATATVITGTDSNGNPIYGDTSAFSLAKAIPTVVVTDGGGTYNASAFAATATVAGLDGVASNSLEGVPLTLDYQQLDSQGNVIQDQGATAPTAAGSYRVTASFAGTTDYLVANSSAAFTIAQATPIFSLAAPPTIINGTSNTQIRAVSE